MKYDSGFKKIKNVDSVFISGNEIIVFGEPKNSEDENHNCDEMGCSSVNHILLRGCFRWMEKGYSAEFQESGDFDA